MEAPKKTRTVQAKKKQQKNFSPSQYSIHWSAVTQGEDYELGGMDDKRLVVTGSLMFCEDAGEEEKKVGFINIVKFRRHGTSAELHDVLDERAEWYEAWPILNEMEEEKRFCKEPCCSLSECPLTRSIAAEGWACG
jgi:hypothetical protein